MPPTSIQAVLDQVQGAMQPWELAFANPARAQEQVLCRLLTIYAQTEDGRRRGANPSLDFEGFRRAYPVRYYKDYQPFIHQTMGGDTSLLLNETPVGWAIPRESPGETRFFPLTPGDLRTRLSAQRVLFYFILATHRTELLSGVSLNLNLPSRVGKMRIGEREIEYGYAPGITMLRRPSTSPLRPSPAQEEIDTFGGLNAPLDREARFELAYQRSKRQTVTFLYGDASIIVQFGRYLRREHKTYPKDVWKIPLLALSGEPGITTRLSPLLRVLYGPAAVREVFAGTEGCYGQQMDENRAWVPNYDQLWYEVETVRGMKMLHEMKPGETGSLVVSTPVLARYATGDTILAFEAPYFRTIGRDQWDAPLRYIWREVSSLGFGRL